MLTGNNLDLLDEAVKEHQSRIQEAARDARGDRPAGGDSHSLRVRLGDHLIAWGEAIRGGLRELPGEGRRELLPRP